MAYKLLSAKQTKGDKAVKYGYLQGILQLEPAYPITKTQKANLEKVGFLHVGKTTCPYHGICKKVCLSECGYNSAVMNKHAESARVKRTLHLLNDPAEFLEILVRDIHKLEQKAVELRLLPVIRLNGISDLYWPDSLFSTFPRVRFLDYTKDEAKALDASICHWPKNYHLTFSWNERVEKHKYVSAFVDEIQSNKRVNIAVIFDGKTLPKTYTLCGKEYPVIDGDVNDLRFLDSSSAIVGLRFKRPIIAGRFKEPKGFHTLVKKV